MGNYSSRASPVRIFEEDGRCCLYTVSSNKNVKGGVVMKSEVVIGILTLDMAPERLSIEEDTPGCLSNNETLDFHLKRGIVRGATDGSPWWNGGKTSDFIEAAKKLEARGAKVIGGDCGFISIYQKDIARVISVSVVTSSLLLVPLVYRMLAEDKKVGILTASSERLGERQFNAVGWSSKDVPVVLKGWGNIEWDPIMGADGIPKSELVKAAKELIQENPDVGAIVIECSVMPRYTHAIHKATGLPVFDITTLIKLVYAAVDPPDYSRE